MIDLTPRVLQKQILRSQFLGLALISLVLITLHATPASGQWVTNGNNINNTNTGNVGIGTTTPSGKVSINLSTIAAHAYGLGIKLDYTRANDNQQETVKFVTLSNVTSGVHAWDLTSQANRIQHIGAGTSVMLNAASYQIGVGNGGTISNATALVLNTPWQWDAVHPAPTGTITNLYGLRILAQGPPATNVSIGTNYGIYLESPTMLTGVSVANNYALYAASAVQKSYFAGNVGIGITTPTTKLHVVGDINATGTGNITAAGTITGGTIIAKYQDVAEWVPASEQIPAGTVVVLDSTKSNHVISSTRGYDTRVAGVISAQPGITLGESGQNKVLVATTGRVRIKVDASRGPIQVGDLLVTSDKAGMAMKSRPLSIGGAQLHRPGTLIGKALEPLAKGRGEILVLLSLQ